jgi:hypothetical protein
MDAGYKAMILVLKSIRNQADSVLKKIEDPGAAEQIVGDEGEVLHSTDQGATWAKGARCSKHLKPSP